MIRTTKAHNKTTGKVSAMGASRTTVDVQRSRRSHARDTPIWLLLPSPIPLGTLRRRSDL